MADASSIRKASTLMTAAPANKGHVRYNTTTQLPVWSNGSEWINFSTPTYKQTISYQAKFTADQVTKPIFVATKRCKVLSITWNHETAESTDTTLTAKVTKETGTLAPGTGLRLTTANFDPTATAATVQTGTLISSTDSLVLNAGDRLSVYYSGTSTELAGVVVTIQLESFTPTIQVPYRIGLNAAVADRCFFVATQDYRVVAASEVHAVAGTHAGGLKMQLVKDTSTDAPGAGTDMLSNNTNAGFDLAGTANTVQTGTFKTTTGLLLLGTGNRLSIDTAGTTTSSAGVVITVELMPQNKEQFDVCLRNQIAATDQTDEAFFIAPAPCVLLAVSEVHSVAGSDGSAVNAQIVKDTGTDAAGAGTNLLTNNTNAGFDMKGTANTVQAGTLVSTASTLILDTGNRLSIDYAGAITALAGVVVTARLQWL